jgi:hypothetical protein
MPETRVITLNLSGSGAYAKTTYVEAFGGSTKPYLFLGMLDYIYIDPSGTATPTVTIDSGHGFGASNALIGERNLLTATSVAAAGAAYYPSAQLQTVAGANTGLYQKFFIYGYIAFTVASGENSGTVTIMLSLWK